MKNVIFIALLFSSCMSVKKINRIFRETRVQTTTRLDSLYTNPDTIFIPGKKDNLIIVFNDEDTLAYNAPITATLKIDTSKDDVSIYTVLARDFVVVKVYRSEFERVLKEIDKYAHGDSLLTDYSKLDKKKPFMFISSYSALSIYGEHYLDERKAMIHDIIWVKFGP